MNKAYHTVLYENFSLLTDNGGRVITRKEWDQLKNTMDAYFTHHSDDEIDRRNKQAQFERMREMQQLIDHKGEPKKKPGFVYFLEYEGQGVKIGFTRNLTSRIKQLQIASPFKLNLLFYIETSEPESVEHHLHEHFKDKCLNGEWFDITKEDISELLGVS